jgi:PST family polysaccharide transporter
MRSLVNLIKKTYGMADPDEGRIVIQNAAFLSALQAVTYILPIIVIPYLFRVIGPDKFGLIAFAQAFVQYFMILTDYGFSVSATKEISLHRHEHEKVSTIFSAVMIVKLALACVSFVLLCLVILIIPKFRHDWLIYLLCFGTVIGNTLFPVWFFQGTEKIKYIAELNILGEIIMVFSIFYFVKTPDDYLMVPLIYSTVFLTTGLLGLYIVFRTFRVSFRFEGYSNVRQQLKAGWDIFIATVAINAYTTTRVFAVGLLTNNTMTGFYSISEKIANVAQTFPLTSFTQAIFPRLSKIFHRNKTKALELMQHIQRITIIISLIFLPVIFFFAPFIINIVCGGYYPDAIVSLRLLIAAVLFVSSNAFRIQFLLVCGKTDIYSRIHVMMAMVGLPLIFLLITSYSYVGAAMATLVIEAGIFTITYFTVRRFKFPQ